jgi:ketosteroid isomerase-like protein
MSEENVDLVRRNYEVINSLGRTGEEFVDPEQVAPDLWGRLAPDIELHERAELPDAKVYEGAEEVKAFWRKTQQVFAEVRWELLEVVDLDHAVLAVTKVVATGRGSDVPVELDETDVFWFRDGMIVRLQGYSTKEDALDAARRERPMTPANA